MEGPSLLFTLIAIAGILLTFGGAWWGVRALRGRRPRPHMHERDSHSSGPTR